MRASCAVDSHSATDERFGNNRSSSAITLEVTRSAGTQKHDHRRHISNGVNGLPGVQREEAYQDFAAVTAMEALESMANEIDRVIGARMQKLYGDCLAVYYALEDLAAKDPSNETYVEHMREMETAHQSQYGRAIPPRA
ncbi:MAG TPA: hypothetical protein VGJ88_01955 [Thermoanaerobaculia bacterium]|jgi:hypothetical protein